MIMSQLQDICRSSEDVSTTGSIEVIIIARLLTPSLEKLRDL
jgi:hypothetical protein